MALPFAVLRTEYMIHLHAYLLQFLPTYQHENNP